METQLSSFLYLVWVCSLSQSKMMTPSRTGDLIRELSPSIPLLYPSVPF